MLMIKKILFGICFLYLGAMQLLTAQTACDYLGPNFTMVSAANTFGTGFGATGALQKYVLVNSTTGNIVQVSNTGAFTGIAAGNYIAYALSHDASITGLTVGSPIAGLGGCFLLSLPQNIKVCNVVNKDMSVCLGNPIIAQSQPGTWSLQGNNYFQTYVLVSNATGLITSIQASGVFPAPPLGNYTVYAVNYRGPSMPAGLVVGQSFATINFAAACAVASPGAAAKVVTASSIINNAYQGGTGFADACANAASSVTSSIQMDNTCALPVSGVLGTALMNGRTAADGSIGSVGSVNTVDAVPCGGLTLDLNDNPLFYAVTCGPSTTSISFTVDHNTVTGDIVRLEGVLYGPIGSGCPPFPVLGASYVDCEQNNSPMTTDLTLTYNGALPGQTYMVIIDAIGEGSFVLNGTLYPVEYLSFEAYPESYYNQLKWVTATELNNDRFEVEHSADAVNFTQIGTVKGAGTTPSPQSYGFQDLQPFEKTFYRLKQVDFDGEFTYSNVVEVLRDSRLEAQVSIFPNPFYDELNIKLTGVAGETQFQLFDATGRRVLTEKWNLQGNSVKTLHLDKALSDGVYFYKVQMEYNPAIKGKLVKVSE